MSSNLLYVPYRKTQRITFSATLRNIITSEFLQTPAVFASDLIEIDTLRNDIIDLNVSTHDLALLKRYYFHLSSLQLKFPDDVEEFPWFGTIGYKITGPVKIKSILFERINILYNIAALYTQLGYQEDRSNNDGLKKGCVFFQYAASFYEFILELIESEVKSQSLQLPLDLQSDVIKALYYISLAQAQEVFWCKAVNDNVKDSLVSRLSLQVSSYYDLSLQHIRKAEGIRTEWIHHITVKKCHFEAAAEYRASLGCMASAKYGEEVARLNKALTLIRSASTSLRFVDPEVREGFEGLAGAVEETARQAEKDNDLIYLQDVPSVSKLAKIQPALAVKCLDIHEIKQPIETLQNSSDYGVMLFKDLLPFTVIQTADSFRDRQEEFISTHLSSPLRSLTLIIRKFLVERQLPGSIDALEQHETLPKSLVDMAHELKSQGGVNRVLESLEDLKKLSADARKFLNDAKQRLELESKEDSYIRSRRGTDQWTRDTSEVAAKPFLERVKTLEAYLVQAENGDGVIHGSFLEIQSNLSLLELPEEELSKHIPTDKPSQIEGELATALRELKSLVNEVKTLEETRESHIELLEMKSRQSPFLPKIISEYKTIQRTKPGIKPTSDLFEPVYQSHMKQHFDQDLQFIEQQKTKQRELETRISQAHVKFQVEMEKASMNQTSEKQRIITTLETSFVQYKELIENITQGLKFYHDFIGNAISLTQDVESFVTMRRIEARDLEIEISSNFQKLSVSNSPDSTRSNSNPTVNKLSHENPISERIHSPVPRHANGNNPNIVVKTVNMNITANDKVSKDQLPNLSTAKSQVWNPASGIKFD
ncbi:hypothetical protein WICPIJ_000014 [Wickerhamomyces pijperi]|uniref:BRO1 domain-containing protein n=1 Tax=Wickerhamomyces pijperi TaxID=599730 RepID=A0A9P8TSI5_WICPI|nr:hypothetical protein WICPIJ_000014 [Wickerhamomyces pijperi]